MTAQGSVTISQGTLGRFFYLPGLSFLNNRTWQPHEAVKIQWMLRMDCFPPNSYAEALTHSVTAFGDGACGNWVGLDDIIRVGPCDGLSGAPTTRECACSPTPDTVRQQQQEEHAPQNPNSYTLTLDFPASALCEINVCCLSQPVCDVLLQ